jgi:hypothetical protein
MENNDTKRHDNTRSTEDTPAFLPTEPSPIPIDSPETGGDMDFGRTDELSENNNTDTEITKPVYYCPMKCEGEKTYDQPGNCPVCGMHLVTK